jgi:hypothetical protein
MEEPALSYLSISFVEQTSTGIVADPHQPDHDMINNNSLNPSTKGTKLFLRAVPFFWWIAVVLLTASSLRLSASDISMSTNDLARAIQVSTSITKLTANKVNAVRDQAWLSFMVEFYKRNPNAPASAVAATYSSYTNAFQRLSTVANFPSQYSNPSAPELYNLILTCALTNLPTNIAPYVAYAASAVEIANELQSQGNSAVQSLVNNVQSFSSYGFQTTLARLNSSLLSATNLHTLVDSSLTLAAADSEFNQAYQSIISPITQMTPGDTLAQVLQEVPELASDPTISALQNKISNGVLELSTNDVISLFANQMAAVNQTIANSAAGLAQIVDGQTNMLNYLQNPDLFSKVSDLQANLLSSATPVIQSATAAFDLLGSIVAQADASFAPLANAISTIGQGATAVADSVSSVMDAADLAGTVLGSFDGVGAVMDIAGLFTGGGLGGLFGGGGGSSSADQQILAQLSALQNQIANLQADMDARFNQVDSQLTNIYTTMTKDFGAVIYDLNNLQSSVNADSATLISATFQNQLLLLSFEANLQSWLVYRDQYELQVDINTYLPYPSYNAFYPNNPLPYSGTQSYQTAEGDFYNEAYSLSYDTASAPAYSATTSLQNQLIYPPESLLNILNGYLNQYGVPFGTPYNPNLLPNPVYWAIAANCYGQLLRENPQFAKQNPAATILHINNISSVGRTVQSALANITITNGISGTTGINWPLWNAAFDSYSVQLPTFANAFQTLATNWEQGVGLTNYDAIHGSNYLTALAGTISFAPINQPQDNTGASATFNDFTSLFPMADGTIAGVDYLPNASNTVSGAILPGGFEIRHVHAGGVVGTTITSPPSPFIDGVQVPGIVIGGSAITRAGVPYVTYWVFTNLANPGLPTYSIAAVNNDGTLTTVAGQKGLYGHQDGLGNQALFASPGMLTMGPGSSVYIIDGLYLRVMDINTNVSTFYAGLTPGVTITAMVVDNQTNVYLGESIVESNSLSWQVEKVGSGGAGASVLVSGPAGTVYGMAIGPNGILYIDYAYPAASGNPSLCEILASVNTTVPSTQLSLTNLWTLQVSNTSMPVVAVSDPIQPPLTGFLSGVGWPGIVPLYGGVCVDQMNNIYGSTGSTLMMLGVDWNVLGLFLEYSQAIAGSITPTNLPTFGTTLFTNAQNLEGAASLIDNLVQLGLSQSYNGDDLLHSLLAGSNQVVGSSVATSLINQELAALTGIASPQQNLDLPTLASNRFAALERQIKVHLLEADSRARAPGDSLVLDLIISNNAPLDDSLSGNSNSIASSGTPSYIPTPSYPPYGSAPIGESLNFNNNQASGFTITSKGGPVTGDLALGTNTDFTVAFWAAGNLNSTVMIGSGNLPGWEVGLTNGGSGVASFEPSSGVNTTSSFSTNNVHLGGWNYYVFVFARSAGLLQCYVNGTSVGSVTLMDNGDNLGSGVVSVSGQSVTNLPVLLNEISLWKRALGAGEVSSIYNGGTNGLGVIALSTGFVRNPNPAEPFSIVNYTLQDLQLMSNMVASPSPSTMLALAGGSVSNLNVQVYGVPGWNYTLQSSTNLVSWQPFMSNVQESVTANVGSTNSSNLFFRAASY